MSQVWTLSVHYATVDNWVVRNTTDAVGKGSQSEKKNFAEEPQDQSWSHCPSASTNTWPWPREWVARATVARACVRVRRRGMDTSAGTSGTEKLIGKLGWAPEEWGGRARRHVTSAQHRGNCAEAAVPQPLQTGLKTSSRSCHTRFDIPVHYRARAFHDFVEYSVAVVRIETLVRISGGFLEEHHYCCMYQLFVRFPT